MFLGYFKHTLDFEGICYFVQEFVLLDQNYYYYLISLFTGLKRQMLEPTLQLDDGTYRLYIPEYIDVEDDLRLA